MLRDDYCFEIKKEAIYTIQNLSLVSSVCPTYFEQPAQTIMQYVLPLSTLLYLPKQNASLLRREAMIALGNLCFDSDDLAKLILALSPDLLSQMAELINLKETSLS